MHIKSKLAQVNGNKDGWVPKINCGTYTTQREKRCAYYTKY